MQAFIRMSQNIRKLVTTTGCPQFMYEDWIYFYLNAIIQQKCFVLVFKVVFFFIEGKGWRVRAKETSLYQKNIHQLPLTHLQLGTWPTTQVYAPAGNQTNDLSVCGMTPIPQSCTSQGRNAKS